MRLSEALCYGIARREVVKAKPGSAAAHPATYDPATFKAWRQKELEGQYREHFSFDLIRGRDVIDFGCGAGELAMLTHQNGARSVVGIEADPEQYEKAVTQFGQSPVPFRLATDLERIDLPDQACDVVLCFDVLEHILSYRSIIPEWLRILRPGGRVLIWWTPYYHPYGHHVQSLVPIPWAHAIFSDRTIIKTCARVYDMHEFVPRQWDLDADGRKKPNKWRQMKELPTLNKLTVRTFERLCGDVGFQLDRVEYHTIRPVKKLVGDVAKLPVVREFLSQCVIYELRRP